MFISSMVQDHKVNGDLSIIIIYANVVDIHTPFFYLQWYLIEIERRVSADSVIVIDQIEYEVDCRFAKQRIKLRYSPDFKDIFIVEADGTLTPIRLLNKTENAFVKREKIHLCRGEE